MRRIASLLVLFGMVTGASAYAQNAAVERGIKVYADSKCAMCHSIAGKGNAKGVLNDVGARLSSDDIRQWLVNPQEMRDKGSFDRKPIMKSFASLPKGDLDALVAYLQTLKVK